MGDSLLWGMKAPFFQPSQSSEDVCCLTVTRVQNVVQRTAEAHLILWQLLPLLLFDVGTNDTARGNLDHIKKDYRALGMLIKGMWAQVVFSCILPVRGRT